MASLDPSAMKVGSSNVYKSKIASVPTPGYAGHTSIFIKPVSYINKDQNFKEEEKVNVHNNDHQFVHVLGETSNSSEVIFKKYFSCLIL